MYRFALDAIKYFIDDKGHGWMLKWLYSVVNQDELLPEFCRYYLPAQDIL